MDEMRIVEAISKLSMNTRLDNKPEFDDSKKQKDVENSVFKKKLDSEMDKLKGKGVE